MRGFAILLAAGSAIAIGAATLPAHADEYGWRGHEWREHAWRAHEWREHEWREHAWRRHEWREHRGWYPGYAYYYPGTYGYYGYYGTPGVTFGVNIR